MANICFATAKTNHQLVCLFWWVVSGPAGLAALARRKQPTFSSWGGEEVERKTKNVLINTISPIYLLFILPCRTKRRKWKTLGRDAGNQGLGLPCKPVSPLRLPLRPLLFANAEENRTKQKKMKTLGHDAGNQGLGLPCKPASPLRLSLRPLLFDNIQQTGETELLVNSSANAEQNRRKWKTLVAIERKIFREHANKGSLSIMFKEKCDRAFLRLTRRAGLVPAA